MAAAIAAIAGLLSAGAAIQQSQESRKQAGKARKASRRQAGRQRTLLAEQEQLERGNLARDEARRRQRARAVGARGFRRTILTGPLGSTGQGQVGGKTLLGS